MLEIQFICGCGMHDTIICTTNTDTVLWCYRLVIVIFVGFGQEVVCCCQIYCVMGRAFVGMFPMVSKESLDR